LALPREAHEVSEFNGLRKGLGNNRPIELHGILTGRPKPFPPNQQERRPGGTRHQATMLAERLLDGEAEAMVRKVIEKAKQGDMIALRLAAAGAPARVSSPPSSTARAFGIQR
jgi:hypothetical protein